MSTIAGKTVVITGAARGIGLATAKALLARGARVVIGDRDADSLTAALATMTGTEPISGHLVDVTDTSSFAAFLDRARADGLGHIDVLINNAGVMPVGHFLEQSDQAIKTAVEVNFSAVLTGCRLVLPEMVDRRSGHIVNIASLAGSVPVPGEVVYAGTKAAVIALSTAMADEFAPHGVQISAVQPPFTTTELIAGITTPSGSKPVTPETIAAAVVRVLEKPTTHVTIPRSMRVVAPLMSMMGPRSRRWLNRRVGSDRAFLEFDSDARRAYQQRIENPSDGR
ncbi:SDR family oxidoreductase [Mycobacterium sp. OTB74]|uniref:SDR family oxidoreductase n=1 Tax=Mycobacterium sp. OTB74 TaxID=1853452 RepID=UPI0024772C6C|nr:SDR family oxidoreductase [Mycobacterium sp. OTB74]MDH6246520.1 NADP-dependent 3-hydroxy acid dehydrogenase YdfG [Mycobacterium sp. OTB74]